jgi:hypothetical protein
VIWKRQTNVYVYGLYIEILINLIGLLCMLDSVKMLDNTCLLIESFASGHGLLGCDTL